MDKILARLAAISAAIAAIDDDATPEQLAEIEGLNKEFDELIARQKQLESVAALKAKTTAGTGRKTAPVAGNESADRIIVGKDLKQERFGGFNSSGDFLASVRNAGMGTIDRRFQNVIYEKSGEDGGFLVPEDMAEGIRKKLNGEESLLSKINLLNVTGNSMTLNVDESQPWNQGIQAYWVAEGATITQSKPKFTQGHWRLHKLAALVTPTDELLDDAPALESYIKNAAPNAIVNKVNGAIVAGDGVGKPKGFLSSGFRVTAAADNSQTADTVTASNILNMYAHMFATSRLNAAWFYNAGVEPQLMQLKDGDGHYIFMAPNGQMNGAPYGTLLGRPVFPMLSAMPALGDEGDIVFADLNYYYGIQKAGGIKSDSSIHVYFDRDLTAFRFTYRIDGNVPFKTPVTTEFGAYQQSGIVTLAAR